MHNILHQRRPARHRTTRRRRRRRRPRRLPRDRLRPIIQTIPQTHFRHERAHIARVEIGPFVNQDLRSIRQIHEPPRAAAVDECDGQLPRLVVHVEFSGAHAHAAAVGGGIGEVDGDGAAPAGIAVRVHEGRAGEAEEPREEEQRLQGVFAVDERHWWMFVPRGHGDRDHERDLLAAAAAAAGLS